MPNGIAVEKALSNSLCNRIIKEIPNSNGLIAIDQDNVALIELILTIDSSYCKAMDPTNGPGGNYKGSSAYWITKLKHYKGSYNDLDYRNLISMIVSSVDSENSTHINADRVGRDEIANRIINYGHQKMVDDLKAGNLSVYDEIRRVTNSGKKPCRENVSFASKFCHYMCFYIFEGLPEQDNYSIHDSVVKKVLPKYLDLYKIPYKPADIEDYASFRKLVDDVISKSGSGISRNGFDHLLWYYYKGKI